jgi:ABC-2 type transport system permease protein
VSSPVKALRDSAVVTRRNLITIVRLPDLAFGATVQPLMFVLLFAYVFGGSLGGGDYREFLIAGIFAQTVAFNAAFTTIGMANDLQKGIIDRFRSLPMSRVAVILGRTTSDLVLSAITLVVMATCGLIVGWRIRGGLVDAVAGFAVMLLFAFAMSWVGVTVGLMARSVEVAQSAGLIWLFPFTFISSAFVSAASLPGPLRLLAEWNPVTAVAAAGRDLFANKAPAGFAVSTGWPAQHSVLYATLSSVAIIVLFMPLAVAKYRSVSTR